MLCPTGLVWWCPLMKIPGRGRRVPGGGGGRMGLLPSHFLLPLTPNHALTRYSLKSLYTFLKVKKNQGGGSDKMAVPLLFKNSPGFAHHVSPHAFSQLSVTWSRWCQGRWKPCLQLPLRKCVTTWEEQKEIWAQPSLFATVYLWGSSSIQAQPEREIPVLQLVRYSRLVTKPHTIQMPSKVAGAGKHSTHWSYHIP